MKNYKMIIISLLLLIFLVGAVSAADENATDSLEVSDEIEMEEVSSDVNEELNDYSEINEESGDVLGSSEGDVLGKPSALVIENEFKALYGEGKNYTLQFYDGPDMDPVPNENVIITLVNIDTDEEAELESITDEDGNANFLIIDLPVGEYMVTQFDMDGYTKRIRNAFITVYDPDSKGYVSLSWSTEAYGLEGKGYQVMACNESIKYRVGAYDLFGDYVPDAFIEYSIGNITGNLTSGGEITLDSLPVGVYVLNVTCSELNISTNTTLYVLKERFPLLTAEDMTVVGGNGIEFKVKTNDRLGNPNSYYNFILSEYALNMYGNYAYKNMILQATADEDGIVIFNFNLTSGIHTVGIQETYETHGDIFLWNITVLNQSSIVESDVEDLNKVSISFTDMNGTALADSEVKFLIGDETYNATTDANGVASFDLSVLPLGEYNVTVVNPATGQKTIKSVSLTTNETIFADDVSAVFNNNSKFSAFFTDKYGKALANTNVTFIVGNETIIATTDDNGVAEFIVSALMDAGNHTVTIKNPVAGEITKTLTINKTKSILKASDVSMTYNVPKNLVITLIDPNDGSFLRNKSVTILLNGQTYNKVTNDNGQVTLSVNLAAKTYDAKITFAGDKNYIDSQATAKINVAKANAKMTAKKATFKAKTKTKKYSIVLKDNKNKALSKVKVTIKVKGKTYKATTNSKGKATFKITKLTKKGKHTAKVKFAGNNNFKALSKSVKITIK